MSNLRAGSSNPVEDTLLTEASRISYVRPARFGEEVGALMETAWNGLGEMSLPVKLDFQLLCAPSGEFRDFFAAGPYFGLDLSACLIQDLGLSNVADRDALERKLFLASAFYAAAVLLNEQVMWGETGRSCETSLLSSGLLHYGLQHLSEGVPGSQTMALSCRCWNEHAVAMTEHQRRRVKQAALFTEREWQRIGRRWSPLKAPVLAAAHACGRDDLVPQLDPLLDRAATLFQISRDLPNVNQDLARGHFTYPIVRAMSAAGMNLAQPPSPMGILFALMITRSTPELVQECLEHHAQMQTALDLLGLPTLREMFQPLATPFQELSKRFARKSRDPEPKSRRDPPAAMVLRFDPHLQQALQMANGCILADSDFRECWEVHRWGLYNAPVLTSRVFPTGLVLEQLLESGVDCSAQLPRLYEHYRQNRFHYFDELCALPPDIDELGLMLRLTKFGSVDEQEIYSRLLETPLQWMLCNIQDDGDLPVFMLHGIDGEDDRGYPQSVPGMGCKAVIAGCLLGLLAFNPIRFRDVIIRATSQLCADFASRGMAAVTWYDVPYTGWIMLELADSLGKDCAGAGLEHLILHMRERAVGLLQNHAAGGARTHQDAAFYLLASRHTPELAREAPQWVETLLRAQRCDGSWDDCPAYLVPNRGNMASWYSSRTVTSAFCYRALASQSGQKG